MSAPKKSPKQAPTTPDTSVPAQPVTSTDVLPNGVAPATPDGPALLGPAPTPESGDVENSTLVGDGTGDLLPDLVAESMTVVSQIDGFRRAGIAWSRTPTTISLDELSDEAIEALVKEPLLDVVFNAAPDEKAAG